MSSITPGPWEYEKTPHGGFLISQVGKNTFHTSTHYEADARLIVLAPELLEAVQELLYYAREVCDNSGGPEETRGRAPRILKEIQEYEALLRRIEGEEAREA